MAVGVSSTLFKRTLDSHTTAFYTTIVTNKLMRELPLNISNERRLKAMTGLTYEVYENLLIIFSKVYLLEKNKEATTKIRKRKPGGGRKGALSTIELKLLFLLYYFKAYPSFELLGDRFGVSTSKAHENFYKLLPFLQKTLEQMNLLSNHSFKSVKSFAIYLKREGGLETLLLEK